MTNKDKKQDAAASCFCWICQTMLWYSSKKQLRGTVAGFIVIEVFIKSAVSVRDADDAALAERVRLLNPLSCIGTEEKSVQAKHYRIRSLKEGASAGKAKD